MAITAPVRALDTHARRDRRLAVLCAMERIATDRGSAADHALMIKGYRNLFAALETGRAVDLDEAFGLRAGRGERSLQTIYAVNQRNRQLRLAGFVLAGNFVDLLPERERWCWALKLRATIEIFHALRWPTWRTLAEPPPRSTLLDTALFRAARYSPGGTLPMDATTLLEVLLGRDP